MEIVENKIFSFKHEHKMKVLHGKYNLKIIINQERFDNKRKMPKINSLNLQFDPSLFNFTKIQSSEKILQFEITNELLDSSTNRSTNNTIQIIINTSPIVDGHYMLLCNPQSCLVQRIDEFSLKVACDICNMSDGKITIGFNSVCASSTINHQHYHMFVQFPYKFPVMDYIHKLEKTSSPGLYYSSTYPFPFLAAQYDSNSILKYITRLTEYLLTINIAYNILVFQDDHRLIWLLLYPRKPLIDRFSIYDSSFLGFS
ncbi:hypothetical protein HZS_6207, partial [Henneguya salminicola]